MTDDGVIKYQLDWTASTADFILSDDPLIAMRDEFFDLGLIGEDENGIGYGNISRREKETFIISGTQTGKIPRSKPAHYCQVTDYDIHSNRLSCRGPVKASSESLTHAAVYELSPIISAVLHIHSRRLWEKHRGKLPTTGEAIPYGTPEMAYEINRLFKNEKSGHPHIMVMAGHQDGIISFAASLESAAGLLRELNQSA